MSNHEWIANVLQARSDFVDAEVVPLLTALLERKLAWRRLAMSGSPLKAVAPLQVAPERGRRIVGQAEIDTLRAMEIERPVMTEKLLFLCNEQPIESVLEADKESRDRMGFEELVRFMVPFFVRLFHVEKTKVERLVGVVLGRLKVSYKKTQFLEAAQMA